MAELVGQNQQSAFTTPTNSTTADAAEVLANDNAVRGSHNAHDNDETVHFQSGATADRPAAGNLGAKFLDRTTGKIYYDNGSSWVEVAYAPDGAIDGADITTGVVDETVGGTGQSSFTKGDLLVATGASALAKLPVGTDGEVLVADSAQAEGVAWTDAPQVASLGFSGATGKVISGASGLQLRDAGDARAVVDYNESTKLITLGNSTDDNDVCLNGDQTLAAAATAGFFRIPRLSSVPPTGAAATGSLALDDSGTLWVRCAAGWKYVTLT